MHTPTNTQTQVDTHHINHTHHTCPNIHKYTHKHILTNKYTDTHTSHKHMHTNIYTHTFTKKLSKTVLVFKKHLGYLC